MTNHEVARGLALDSAGTDGPTSEVTQAVELAGNNAIQVQVLVYALTATNVSIQIQTSNDEINWSSFGTAQTATAIGRKLLTMDTAVGSAFVRVKFTITGSGKAILDAWLFASPQ